MTFLTAHLPFASSSDSGFGSSSHSSPLPPPRAHLLISDTITSAGHFALYHLISGAIAQKLPVIWIDLRNEGRPSLEAVLRKMSVTLPTTPGSFQHIQPSSLPTGIPTSFPGLYDKDDVATLKPTFTAIKKAIGDTSKGSLIVLDGLSELLSIGFETKEISRFVRAVSKISRDTGSILISTIHADHLASSSLPPHSLLETLLRISDGWWRIEGLASGRSGDVHGEISSHPLVTAPLGWPSIPKSQPLQYRLEATTVKVFPKGTGRGYL